MSNNDTYLLTELPRETPCLPALIGQAGERARDRYIEFFTASIRNRGTRAAYAHASRQFFHWCYLRGVKLDEITPVVVATYIEQMTLCRSAPTVKLHLAAIRQLFDFLVTGQIIASNPAASVRGPRHVAKKGKTPVLLAEEARLLLDSIDTSSIIGLRDRALIGVMLYSFARVSATTQMNVEDYFLQGRRMWFRLHEKGGKLHDVPAHHNAEAYVDAYVQAAAIADQLRGPLFRTIDRWRKLTINVSARVRRLGAGVRLEG
jgi:integrase/recombinase XerD